jgi:hypothetical protein
MMKRKDFQKTLDEALESIETEEDRIIRIRQIQEQISQLEEQVTGLRQQMQHEMEGLLGELAVSIRNRVPGLSVSLNGGRCHVKHLANSLSFRPDMDGGTWDVETNRSGRRFRKAHGHALGLKHDVGPLADAASSFFKKRYRRLNNESRPIQHKGISKTQASGYYA